jgi:tetratricopeptide (TPR) repeat protein
MKYLSSSLSFLLLVGTALFATEEQAENLKPVLQIWPHVAECIELVTNDDLVNAAICASEQAHEYADAGSAHLQAAIELLRGNDETALKFVGRAIEMDGEQHLHYGLKARIYIYQLRNASNGLAKFSLAKKALASYEKALKLKPDVLEYRAYLVNYKLKAPAIAGGDTEEALALAEEGVSLDVEGSSLLRARVYLKMKQPDKAIPDLSAAQQEGFFDAGAFVSGGYWAIGAEKWDLAKSYFAYLIEKDPDNPNSYDCMGDYYLARADKPKALELFAEALVKNPDFKPAKEKYEKLQSGS